MAQDSIQITFRGWDLVAHFTYTPERPDTYWQPAEGGFDEVWDLRTKAGNRDVSFLLKKHEAEITQLVVEAVDERRRDSLEDADPDYQPTYFPRHRSF